jgi:hypothetical protein
MKILYELSDQVSRQRKVIEALLPADPKSPLKKFYQILLLSKKYSEEECMKEIYGKKNITAFSRLKSRLKEILLQVIVFQINTNTFTDIRSNVQLHVALNSLLGRSLNLRRLEWISAELLEKSLSKAIKYSFTDEVLIHVRQLIIYYSSHSRYNKYKAKKYSDLQKKYLYIYEWELKSENYYLDLQSTQFQSLANASEETKLKSIKYYRELEKINDINTFRFRFNRYRIFASYFEYTKDYKSLLTLSEGALREFASKEFSSELSLYMIQVRQLWALIQAGRLEETILVGQKSLNKISANDVNWYRLAYYVLKAELYSKNYENAVDLICNIISSPKFPKLNEYYHEIFYTTLGYIHLLFDSGYIADTLKSKDKLPDFKLGKFLNTTPVFSKDKMGINVSILLMHIAYLLQRKDFNAIIDRTDSLNQYAYRYLRQDDSFRSNCMIKMVIQMTKADFNSVRTERYTHDLRKKLSKVNLAGSGENIEIEVIPFEILWEIMMINL